MSTSPFLSHAGLLKPGNTVSWFKWKPPFFLSCWYFWGGCFTCSVSDVLPLVHNRYIIFDIVHLYCRPLNRPMMPLFAVYFQLIVSCVQPLILFRDKWLPSCFFSPLARVAPSLWLCSQVAAGLLSCFYFLFFLLLYRYKVFLWFTALE